jgi:hypothetical protein
MMGGVGMGEYFDRSLEAIGNEQVSYDTLSGKSLCVCCGMLTSDCCVTLNRLHIPVSWITWIYLT